MKKQVKIFYIDIAESITSSKAQNTQPIGKQWLGVSFLGKRVAIAQRP